MSSLQQPAAGEMRVSGSLVLQAAESQRDQMMRQLAGNPHLTLDLGAVEAFDTTGLQLLLAARKTALAAGGSLRLRRASAEVLQFAASLGLSLDEMVEHAS
jgi:anti-sigma B factor antagonist